MLVDVVLMRRGGNKLPAEQIKAAAPIRGRLQIYTRPWRETWAPHQPQVLTTFAQLYDHLEDDPIAQPVLKLRDAHVNAWKGSTFVLVGLERSGPELREIDEAQAWLCRLVRDQNNPAGSAATSHDQITSSRRSA